MCGGSGKMKGLGLMPTDCTCLTIPQGYAHTLKTAETLTHTAENSVFEEVKMPAKEEKERKRMGRPPKIKPVA